MMGDFGRRGGRGVGTWSTPSMLGGGGFGTTLDPFWDSDILGGWDTMPIMTPLLTSGAGGLSQPLLGKGEEESKMADIGGGTGTALTQRGGVAGQLPVLRCRVNVEDQDKQFVVTAEAPGFDKENLKVNISDDNVLTISGEQKKEHIEESKDKRFLRTERSFGTVRRSLRLPKGIDKAGVSANYINGILHIAVPKKEEAASKYQVQIS
jgi:HSP20 family protein